MLEALGLDPDEALAYRCLVEVPASTSRDLARAAGMGLDRTRAVLGRLEDKGLAARSTTGQSDWVAAPPALALGALVVQHQEALREAEHEIAGLVEQYRGVAGQRDLTDVVDVVRGPDAVAQRLGQLQQGATELVQAFVKADVAVVEATETPDEDAAVDRGVAYRVVVERGALERPGFVPALRVALGRGQQIRVTGRTLVRMVISDGDLAMVPVGSAADGDLGALLVHASGLLDGLLELFELEWQAATPLTLGGPDGQDVPVPGGRDIDVPDERDEIGDLPDGIVASAADRPDAEGLEVLSLLVAGLTDRTIAAQLDVSARTVQRRVSDLLDLAGVTTRLQLGHEAARRRWV